MEEGAPQQTVDIEFRDLRYMGDQARAKEKKPILRGISGQFRSGYLTAILGPSGAGKTSLLNILSGFRNKGVAGSILVNGKDRVVDEFRNQSSYITQEFDMFPQLSTRETLLYAADFKLGRGVTEHHKAELINKILDLLGLRKAEDTSVGKLSGGEKKRLSIGVELITNPPVMFFDEPTSGLDSSSSLQVISHLKSLAQGGRTVVCTIHQPSSRLFEMFDDLYILAEGQCLYNGPVREMTAVFEEAGFPCPEHHNRADFALEIASRKDDEKITNLVSKYSKRVEVVSPETYSSRNENAPSLGNRMISRVRSKSQYKVSAWLQIYILVRRSILCTLRDMYTTRIRIVTHVLVGLVLGALCYRAGDEASKVYTNVAYIFFFLMFLFFINPVLTVLTFPMEAGIVGREHLNSWYTLYSYCVSKLIAEVPLQILCPTLFMLASYALSGQPQEGSRIIRLWSICILLAFLGQLLGYVFGAAFGAQVGIFLIGILQNPMLLLSGFFVRVRDLPGPLRVFTIFSYYRYAFQAAMQSLYGFDRPNLKCSQPYCRLKSPADILEEFDMQYASYERDLLAIVIWIFAFQIVLYVILMWKYRTSK
ncbi:ATP-binding cassette subfamily G member 4-like [Periplaneta americana]|uniref:ATP-binding cassette subfamily G member 4-like n=1 Tax=Periplaneta americana TaxID=6978 RepID=UPI0037E7DFD5